MIRGRPIRFLVTILGGWTAFRLSMLLPFSFPIAGREPLFAGKAPPPRTSTLDWMFPERPLSPELRVAESVITVPSVLFPAVRMHRPPVKTRPAGGQGGWSAATAGDMLNAPMGFAHEPHEASSLAGFAVGTGLTATEAGLPATPRTGRWSGVGWMLWRNDAGGPGYAVGPRLGASQLGVRIDYAVAPDSALRPALYARASGALQAPAAAELAVGIAIRPHLPLPLLLAVERRQGVSEGGRSAFALLAAGGINPVAIGHGFRLDGYGQTGIVGFGRRDAFADGRLTVERPVAGFAGLAVGFGLWGGVQPGASRLDMGPQASLRLPVGDMMFRLGAEWRERVAGNAEPSSGPALSIGTDF